MRMSDTTVDKITGVLKDLEAGLTVRGACRRHHLSLQTFYRWKNAMPGRVPERRVRYLEVENRKLRQKVAELSLDYNALRTALVKEPKREC